MSNVKVSVILTSFNHKKYLGEAIDSVLNQTFTDFELIIWDDASSDESWSIITSYKDQRIKAFRNEAQKRAVWGVNKAISEIAKGEYVAIHHSDDVWEIDKLEKQVTFLDKNPEVGAVFTWVKIIDEDGHPFQNENHFYYKIFEQPNRSRHEWLNFFFYHGNALCHPSVLVRKKCYEDVGPYRYGFAQLADFDMWVRLCFRYEIHILPEKLTHFRIRDNEANTSGNTLQSRTRIMFELFQVYKNYLQIPSQREVLQIFPESLNYLKKNSQGDLQYILAQLALKANLTSGYLFGLQLLFDILQDKNHLKIAKDLHDFNATSFIELTASYDVFNFEGLYVRAQQLAEQDAQLAERDAQLAERDAQLAERDAQLAERDAQLIEVYASKAWRIITIYRFIIINFSQILRWPGRILKSLIRIFTKSLNYMKVFGIKAMLIRLQDKFAEVFMSFRRGAKILIQNRLKTKISDFRFSQYGHGDYEQWIKENEPTQAELLVQKKLSNEFSYKPLISIIMPIYNTPEHILVETVKSVIAQTYPNWELCISNGNPQNSNVNGVLEKLMQKDNRIRVRNMASNMGISSNTNAAMELASGEFIALLDHDDTLAPFSLFEVVKLLNSQPDVDFIYSDKDMLTEDGKKRFSPFFKPDWSPDMMISANYLTHLCIIRYALIKEIGGFNPITDGAQDWDMFLRITEKTNKITHISKILYHWRQISTSVASGIHAKPYALQGQIITLENHFDRKGIKAQAYHIPPGHLRVTWPVSDTSKVSVIINLSTASVDRITSSIKRFTEHTKYLNVEFIVICPNNVNLMNLHITNDNLGRIKLTKIIDSSNIIPSYNEAFRLSLGDFILFINGDLIPISDGWLEEMLRWSELNEIGAVGGLLMDWDNTIAYTGSIIKNNSIQPIFSGGKIESIGGISPFGSPYWVRNFSTLSADCFMISRKTFEKLGAFDEMNDVDIALASLCNKIIKEGARITYTPYAQFQYERNTSIRYFPSQNRNFPIVEQDPYFNPNLALENNMPRMIFKNNYLSNIPKDKISFKNIDLGAWTEYNAEASILAKQFDFSAIDLSSNLDVMGKNKGNIKIKRVMWFLPNFNYSFYGGIHTIFRFAAYLREQHDVECDFTILGTGDVKKIKSEIERIFPSLDKSRIFFIQSPTQIKNLPPSDACIATLWTTAYYALKYNQTLRKFYFLQDFEPLFYPAGSTFAQVEATYRFGFYGIANTISLKKTYEEEYGGKSEFFIPAVDRKVFYPKFDKTYDDKFYRLFFYGRPGHPRNAFELGGHTLKILKDNYQNQLDIVSAGSEWNPSQFGLGNVVRNLGLLPYRQTADLYRSCDLGLILMFTRHPSYLPFELMACGATVVTNYNRHTLWALKDEENCFLSNASATSLAETIKKSLDNPRLRQNININSLRMIDQNFSDWNIQFQKVFRYMENEK